jgi:hypothetical protein
MSKVTFERETEHVQAAISASPLRSFAVPHLVVDNIFPDVLVSRIADNWPEYGEGFAPEVPGNHVLQMYRRDYGRIAEPRLTFWRNFNEKLWPVVVAAAAEALAGPAHEVFGDLYYKHLALEQPLTLMQADPTYPGHSLHQHYYHCPHWAFTMLLYIDPEDRCSRGTGIHRLLPRDEANAPGEANESETSYLTSDLDWRVEVAMHTQHWLDPFYPDRTYSDQVVEYKANRMFVFLDGPLALHSVPFDNPDHTADPARARDGGRHARRRILRSHVKVNSNAFYRKHSQLLPEPLEPTSYARLMAINPILSADDQRYRETVLRPFFRERLQAYARAAACKQSTASEGPPARFWDRIVRRSPSAGDQLRSQLLERIP